MSPSSWRQRHGKLVSLLFPNTASGTGSGLLDVSDDSFAERLNEVLGENHDPDVDTLTFGNDDVVKLGRLEKGTYGAVDMIRCKLDNRIYARKTLSKAFSHRAREQCFPLTERVIMSLARTSRTPWAPHLIASYQTPLDLCLVMEYVDGGTLSDLMECAQGRISEQEARWWIPQAVAAVGWVHEQGYVHRDIKPANFLITPTSHLRLTDFGSAARLLPASAEGVQLVPRDACKLICGTADYISPDQLEYDEDMAQAAEVEQSFDNEGYGRETDWWSLGVMLYEMVYGNVPFFADTLAETHRRIVNHRKTLKFDDNVRISDDLYYLIRGLLTDARSRLGRLGLHEIQSHQFFKGVAWWDLHKLQRPTELTVPEFIYASQADIAPDVAEAISYSFPDGSFTTIHHEYTPRPAKNGTKLVSPFFGFTWGAPKDAFDDVLPPSAQPSVNPTPRVLRTLPNGSTSAHRDRGRQASYYTPLRSAGSAPETATVRRTRPMSDRQALQQLMSAVRESAHKKVVESGKKPWNHIPRRERTIVPMGQSTGLDLEDEADATFRSEGPPSPSPRPGSALGRGRPPSRSTPTEDWTSILHEREPPDKWREMEMRRRRLMEGIEDAEKRLRQLKTLAGAHA